MALIFEPDPGIFDVYEILGGGIQQALLLGAADFVAQVNKPWAYYAGAAVGGAAVATGIPNAAATVYVIGQTLDFFVFKTPEGSTVDVFLDGVATATISLYAVDQVWEQLQVTLQNKPGYTRVDFVNSGVPVENVSGIQWMALGAPFSLGGTVVDVRREIESAEMTNIVSFSIRDSDGDTNSVPVYLDTNFTIAQYQGFVTAFAPVLDGVIDGVIDSASLQLSMTLPAGLTADPAAGSETQKGANLSFATTTRYSHGVRIPAFALAFFSGKDVLTTGAMATLINAYTGGLDVSGTQIIPRDKYGNDLVSFQTGRKAFRKR